MAARSERPSPDELRPAASFADLSTTDLHIDAYYPGGTNGHAGDDPVAKLIPGVGNQGGFRCKGSPSDGTVRLAVLYTTGDQQDWPDSLDPQTGLFTYYGDNRTPGHELHDTSRKGNLLLRDVFATSYDDQSQRSTIPPFLLFEKANPVGRGVRFRGLLAPGGPSLTSDDELQAIWRTSGGQRFQNYRARFTVLDQAVIPRTWIQHVLSGADPLTGGCPPPWAAWVRARAYSPLAAPATTTIRSHAEQLPEDALGTKILATIREHFRNREHDFEACAVALWRLMAPATGQCDLTRPSRDGGRDAIGKYHLGPPTDRIAIDFALEAKCYAPTNPVGVRQGSRLISRLRHRHFGVLVTTSYFNTQLQQEIRDDQHPIVLICGRDIVQLLRQHGYTTVAAIQSWLDQQFPPSSQTN
ncbi:restriction endonuclease [Sciscionella sediminilitoris]|uniref:restriction endonuclease n=1 Tax=Sciscionella sediminilitoris TaxID=1445613 RepID=UPI000691AFEF|nr:restriction endonuclease [Sciscionella sp. SE31]